MAMLESRALHPGAVAQLGERRVRNAKVEGSIPFRSTTLLETLYMWRTGCERHQAHAGLTAAARPPTGSMSGCGAPRRSPRADPVTPALLASREWLIDLLSQSELAELPLQDTARLSILA